MGRDPANVVPGFIEGDLLDEKVEALCAKLIETFPECMTKSIEELRKPKLEAWASRRPKAS